MSDERRRIGDLRAANDDFSGIHAQSLRDRDAVHVLSGRGVVGWQGQGPPDYGPASTQARWHRGRQHECAAALTEGFDITSMGVAAPHLGPALHLARGDLGPLLSVVAPRRAKIVKTNDIAVEFCGAGRLRAEGKR